MFILKNVSVLPIIVNIPQHNCNPGQLYSKLFDEVEKIKCWKVKVDSDTVQKERRLQENKRTIETQRKAIQELQVCATETSFLYLLFSLPLSNHTYTVFFFVNGLLIIKEQHTLTPFNIVVSI